MATTLVDSNLLEALKTVRKTAANWADLPEWCREGVVDGIMIAEAQNHLTEARLKHIQASLRCAESRARQIVPEELWDEACAAVEGDWYYLDPQWAKECIEQFIEQADDEDFLISAGQLKQVRSALKCHKSVHRKAEIDYPAAETGRKAPGYKAARKQHGRVNKPSEHREEVSR